MSIDTRTRLSKDIRLIERDEIFDSVLPGAIAVHVISPVGESGTWNCRPSDSTSRVAG